MSASKVAAGLTALALGAAVVTALAANPEVKPQAMPAAAEANAARAAPAVAKSDRLPVRAAKPRPVTSACPQEPWPYGCQWRSPTRKVLRPPRAS